MLKDVKYRVSTSWNVALSKDSEPDDGQQIQVMSKFKEKVDSVVKEWDSARDVQVFSAGFDADYVEDIDARMEKQKFTYNYTVVFKVGEGISQGDVFSSDRLRSELEKRMEDDYEVEVELVEY